MDLIDVVAVRKLLKSAIAELWADNEGNTALENVLILGAVVFPLLLFLTALAIRFILWMREQAPALFDEAATFTP